MTQHLSQAQQAQQTNRTADGRYTVKTHAEAEVSLSGSSQQSTASLVPDEVAHNLVATETGITGDEHDAISVDVVDQLQQSRNFSPENVRALTSQIGQNRLGYDPVGRAALRHALTQMPPEQAHYARNELNIMSSGQYAQPNHHATHGQDTALDGSPNAPIAVTDPKVQSGKFFDTVTAEGTTFHRVRDGVVPVEPQAIRIQTDRPLADEDVAKISQMTGYALRTAGQGEGASDPIQDTPYSFIVHNDTTKGGQCKNLDRFQANLHTIMHHGSPVRKTDRAGAGTKGTKLIDGYGSDSPGIEIYYDDAAVDPEHQQTGR